MTKVLITGCNGQLGNELQRIIREGRAEIGPIDPIWSAAEVVPTDVDTLDITDADAVSRFCEEGRFDVIVNCAAMTNVDGCEVMEDVAHKVNALAPRNLARAAQATGARIVQVSTDYVFPGTDPRPRVETDEPAPISAYGRTKLDGERLVAEACERHLIMRTAWLYGYVGHNFVRTMMGLGETHDHVTVVDDQMGNPTSANDLAYEILKVAATDGYGIYHCTNEGTCSWADFAAAIMEGAGLDCEVCRCTSDEYAAAHPDAAHRPAFSSLDNAHLAATVGDEMRPWHDALDSFLGNLNKMEG